ncbi:hypothetical protein K0M31_010858 [Melipona bicolor]|uniref:Uncharacterized protein n=1 Tax=Melipona bicolor TaxID=60889 RepID=A0AA40FL03_9HYME|nr:hypothetical protein K0M31_010858 [Melipona bicolor]
MEDQSPHSVRAISSEAEFRPGHYCSRRSRDNFHRFTQIWPANSLAGLACLRATSPGTQNCSRKLKSGNLRGPLGQRIGEEAQFSLWYFASERVFKGITVANQFVTSFAKFDQVPYSGSFAAEQKIICCPTVNTLSVRIITNKSSRLAFNRLNIRVALFKSYSRALKGIRFSRLSLAAPFSIPLGSAPEEKESFKGSSGCRKGSWFTHRDGTFSSRLVKALRTIDCKSRRHGQGDPS